MVRRSRALYSLLQSVQGTLETIDLLYDSDEDLNEHQAIAQYIWKNVLPDIEPGLLEPGDGFEFFLIDGFLNDYPHSWFALRITAPDLETDAYQIILDPFFPGVIPQIILLDTKSPIIRFFEEKTRWRVGEAPE
jgi:hypothetical protein